jgi:hypothetical protein
MTDKLKLAFEQLEKEMEIISKQGQKYVIGGDGYPPTGDCLAEALAYIFNGTTAAADIYRNMLVSSGTCSVVNDASGNAVYMNINSSSGFFSFLNTAVSGYSCTGGTINESVGSDPQMQTLAQVDLGGSVNGVPVPHAVIITGHPSSGHWSYYNPTNNTSGVIESSKIQAAANICCNQ